MVGIINNRYRILQALGSGGCGQTFLVEDAHLPSKPYRVIKKLKSATDVPQVYQIIKERFDREAAVLEELGRNNDRIPTLYAYFNEGDEFYLVQDWIAGKNLKEAIQEHGTFNETQVRYLLTAVLQVLDFVHSRGIIHRDIKPENIMLRASDGNPVLIDFGAVKEVVATVVDSHGIPTSTIIIGTPGFMPLEQSAGRPVFASDLYSLGLTAIFLLTGKYPLNMLDRQTGEIIWRQYAPPISEQLAAVLSKVIEQNPRDRFLNARTMLQALQAGADDEATMPRRPQNRPQPPPDNPPGRPFAAPVGSGNWQPQNFRAGQAAQVAPLPQVSAAYQRFVIEPEARVKIFLLYILMRITLAVFFNLQDYSIFTGYNLVVRYGLTTQVSTLISIFLNLLDNVALGVMQFWLLRKRLRLTPAWIVVTAIYGLAVSLIQLPFSYYINRGSFNRDQYLVYLAFVQLLFLLFIAVGQTVILHKRVKNAFLWILAIFPAQILYSIIFSLSFSSFSDPFRPGAFVSQIFFSLLRGLFIGVAQALCLLLFQKKEFLTQAENSQSTTGA